MLSRAPVDAPLVESKTGRALRSFFTWLAALVLRVNLSPERVGLVRLATQAAAIATVAIPIVPVEQPLEAGLYRVSWYARITRAATASSSLTVTIGWTDGGVACTASGAAMTGNTTGTVQSGSLLVRADASSTLTYAAAYATSGATTMQFGLELVVERVA